MTLRSFAARARALAIGLALAIATTAAAFATNISLNATTWTDLGAGPMSLSVTGGSMNWQIATTQPPSGSVSLQTITPNDNPLALSTSLHVWARQAGANAATAVVAAYSGGSNKFQPVDASGTQLFSVGNPGNVAGSFSATLSGFAPASAYQTLAVSNGVSSRVALPAGTVVVVYNTGATAASIALGNASVAATATNDVIQPNSWMGFTVGSNVDLAAWGLGGSTTLVLSGGSGLPTGAGGGSGGGGSSAISSWGGGTLGAMANYGSSPGAVLVPGVNASITNTPTVNLGTIGTVATAANQTSGNTSLSTIAGAVSGALFQNNLSKWAGTTLGAPSSYGTSPGVVAVPGVNAFVTNTPSVAQSGAPWTQNVTQFGGSAVATGTGAGGAGVPRVTVSNDSQIITTPKTGAFAIAGCTVGTSSAQCLAGGTYNHVQIQNTSASASIACAWGGTAILNASGSVLLAPGQSALWGPNTAGAPTVALNCIASAAATPLYLESN